MSKKKKNKNIGIEDESDPKGQYAQNTPLSAEERKMLNARKDEIDRGTLPHYDNSDLAKAKRYAKKNKFTVFFVTFTVLMLAAVIALLSFLFIKKLSAAPNKDDFVLTLGEEESVIKYKKAMQDDILYLDAIPIVRYAELVFSGDKDSIKISCPNGSYVRLEHGKDIATVNGERVKVGGKVNIVSYERDEKDPNAKKIECFVPFSFLQSLFSYEVESGSPSMYVSFSPKTNKILFHRIKYKDSGDPLPIAFSADRFDVISETLY